MNEEIFNVSTYVCAPIAEIYGCSNVLSCMINTKTRWGSEKLAGIDDVIIKCLTEIKEQQGYKENSHA